MLKSTEHLVPSKPVGLDPLKLLTITTMANVDTYFNLDVISHYIPLDKTIIGIHYRGLHRGLLVKPLPGEDGDDDDETEPDESESQSNLPSIDVDFDSKKSGQFKNQCTFIINDGTKLINTKLFNNGKIINTGCMDPQQAVFTANLILGRIFNMNGILTYNIPTKLKCKCTKDLKKFYKDDLRKKFTDLIRLLVQYLNLETDLNCFDPKYSADKSFAEFLTACESNPSFIKDIMYVYSIITILKFYYKDTEITTHFRDESCQSLLAIITASTNFETGIISYDFPAYLNNHLPIKFDRNTVGIVVINKSTTCGYFINRKVLHDIMSLQPNVSACEYDKSKYPGVITSFVTTSGKKIKIIVFNTGKINITAANTHEQCQEGYEFIKNICIDHFDELLMVSEYKNKKKEYEDSLPDQHYMGLVNGQEYYLLHTVRILSNPRNVRFLHKLGMIDKYNI